MDGKDISGHLEQVEMSSKDQDTIAVDLPVLADDMPSNWKGILEAAIRGEAADRTLTWRQGIKVYWRCVAWSLSISLCVVMQGFDSSLVGSLIALPVFRQKYGSKSPSGYQLNPAWQTAVTQAAQIGQFFGAGIAAWALPKVGHKRILQVALMWLIGAIFMVFFAPSIQILFVGEVICGMPWGSFTIAVVSYASEVSPVALRGYFTTYINGATVIGQLISAGVVVGVRNRTDQWAYKIPFAVQWFWPVPLLIVVSLAPESPWWLIRHGRLEEAQRSMRRFSKRMTETEAANAVAMMLRTNQHEIDVDPGVGFFDLFRGCDLRRTEIATVGFGVQFLSGSAINGAYFFEQAGLNPNEAFKLNLGSTAVGLIGTMASWITITYVGRRTIFLIGCGNATILLLLVGLLAIPSRDGNTGAKWGQAVLMFLWNANYQATLGPVGYSILGETSSTRLRSLTIGTARNMHSIISVSTGLIGTYQLNPTAWNWKGFSGFFWSASSFLCLLWTFFRLPEYKGRTYRELDILFENKVPTRRFKETQVELTEETVTA